jgi:hypothetical protein
VLKFMCFEPNIAFTVPTYKTYEIRLIFACASQF